MVVDLPNCLEHFDVLLLEKWDCFYVVAVEVVFEDTIDYRMGELALFFEELEKNGDNGLLANFVKEEEVPVVF